MPNASTLAAPEMGAARSAVWMCPVLVWCVRLPREKLVAVTSLTRGEGHQRGLGRLVPKDPEEPAFIVTLVAAAIVAAIVAAVVAPVRVFMAMVALGTTVTAATIAAVAAVAVTAATAAL